MNRYRIVTVLLAFVVILAVGATEFTSEEARVAQSGYGKALEKAKRDYVAALNDALSMAGKANDSAEVTRIATEIKRLEAADNSDQRRAVFEGVMDAEWVGSPNMGTIVFKNDGSLWAEKDQGRCRWAVIDDNTIVSLTDNGFTCVFEFDETQQKVKAFGTGQKSGASWEATRVTPD